MSFHVIDKDGVRSEVNTPKGKIEEAIDNAFKEASDAFTEILDEIKKGVKLSLAIKDEEISELKQRVEK